MDTCLRWKTASDAKCPLCGEYDETWQHVFQCGCNDIQRVHNDNLKKMKIKMEQLKTLPHLQNTILMILRAWRNHAEPEYENQENNPYNEDVKYAFELQKEIGFESML